MTAPSHEEVKTLFMAALDVPRNDRTAWLAREAGDRAELLAEVQSLLDSHEQEDEFLDDITNTFRSHAFAASGPLRSRIGERVGAYRITGVLGTGGMGDVFSAVRDDDQYHAEVAIKLMRADMRSDLTEQRFRKERQILAGLDHRNIARLLDGGTALGGAPYVVMELVNGEPIHSYCDAQQLDVRARVQLFLQVCAAVSYAHQHLVVHRDLKPSNILVTTDASVKLLDFGIAKLLEADAKTDVAEAAGTVTTLRAMTLEYASPEQVRGAPVTTVSDVYSLGVVLYRLLAGRSPYRERATDAARMAEILSDYTPTRPSQIDRRLDSDLDNILLLALRKEPQDRYASVEQFADDLRNYLAGMPVKARGNSLRYRAGKFVRRHRMEIAASLVIACVLVGALVFSVREARIAERERLAAQQHFDSVRKLANTMLLQLHDELARDSGSLKTREMMVRTSLEYLDSLYQQSSSDRRLQEELATAYIKVAAILGNDTSGSNRGDYQGALRNYERAISLLTPLMVAEPENHRAGWALGQAYLEQAALVMVVRGPKHAREAADKGIALMESFAPTITDDAERMLRLQAGYTTQGQILGFMGLTPQAMAAFDKMIAVTEANLQAHPGEASALRAVSRAYNNATLVDDTRLSPKANDERIVAFLEKSIWADEQVLKLQPDKLENHVRLATQRQNLGYLALSHEQYAEARRLLDLAVPVAAAQAARDTDDADAQYTLALFESQLAHAMFRLGEIEEAKALHLKSGKSLATLLARDGSLRTEFAVGMNAVFLGELYEHLAAGAGANRGKQIELLNLARSSLQPGVASLQKVTAHAKLPATDMRVVNDGVASLARVESALATFRD